MKKTIAHTVWSYLNNPVIFLSTLIIITIFACDDKLEPDFTVDFKTEMIDDNHVSISNNSEGEYYATIWDFGNGEVDTTTNKKEVYDIYYPLANDYTISLKVMDFYGNTDSISKTLSITNSDLVLSFSTEINPDMPNYVLLTNTSIGEYDSFKWIYNDLEVENQMEHEAYFPYAGTYDIELLVSKNNINYSEIESVTISEDDPSVDPNLIWSDEFNYSGAPNPAFWNLEIGGNGWGNNELQYYTDLQNNALVDNGVLTITAREESYGGRDYTSARITTQDKFDFQYGRIEARIKLPYGQGLWPAFWMLGADYSTTGWPACGEIDIMEMVGGTAGGDNKVYSTLHWDNEGEHAQYGENYTLASGIFADDFHVFSVQWTSQQVRGYVDDIQYFTINITDSGLSEFHQHFFIILNIAVGGNWPGPPDNTTVFPQSMEVDYVRVYQEN